MQAGFDQSGLSMDNDLGDPRRQSKLPGGYATQGQAVSAPYAEANMKAAEKIVSSHTNSSFIWSPFPGYDHLSAVKYLPFEQENELYNLSIARQNVGNHFTQKGNDLLFDIVDRWLQEKLSGTS